LVKLGHDLAELFGRGDINVINANEHITLPNA
jgi:hypothetical protein